MRILPYILYAVLIAFHQVVLGDLVGIGEFTFNLSGLIVLLVALYKEEAVAIWFGFAAGIIMTAGEPQVMGWSCLTVALLSVAAFHIRQRLNLESLYSKLLVVFVGVVVLNLIRVLIGGGVGFLHLLWASIIPGAIYTTIFGWLFFLFKEKVVTWQRTRELF
jgi:rod shape-determining protein MreD